MIKDLYNYILNKPIYNKIFNNIWIGNKYIVKNKKIYDKIDVIINCSKNIPFYNNSKINHRISINNNNKIDNIKNLETYLEMTADLIQYHTEQNRNILIHCDDSINLSPSILVGYLIKYYNKNLYNACNFIMDKHPLSFLFNTKYQISLMNYEYNILKKNHKNVSNIHFKKFKLYWIIFIIFIIIIFVIIKNYLNNSNLDTTEYLSGTEKKLIYDLR